MATVVKEEELTEPAVEVVEVGPVRASEDWKDSSRLSSPTEQKTRTYTERKLYQKYEKGHREKIVSKYKTGKKQKSQSYNTGVLKTEPSTALGLTETLQLQESLATNTDTVTSAEGPLEEADSDAIGFNSSAEESLRTDQELEEDNGAVTQAVSEADCSEQDLLAESECYSEEDPLIDKGDNVGFTGIPSSPFQDHFSTNSSGSEMEISSTTSSGEMDSALKETLLSSLKCRVVLPKLQSPVTDSDSEWVQCGGVWKQVSPPGVPLSNSPQMERTTPELNSKVTPSAPKAGRISPIRPPSYGSPEVKTPCKESTVSSSVCVAVSNDNTPRSTSSAAIAKTDFNPLPARYIWSDCFQSKTSPKKPGLSRSAVSSAVSTSSNLRRLGEAGEKPVSSLSKERSMSFMACGQGEEIAMETDDGLRLGQWDDDGSSNSSGQLKHCSEFLTQSQPSDGPTRPRTELKNLKPKLLKDLENVMAPTCATIPFSAAPADMATSQYSVSESADQLDYTQGREILPGLQTPQHLGLSDETETDWCAMSATEELTEDKDNDDFDVLSLYDYDTFLEDEVEEPSRGVSQPKRNTRVQSDSGDESVSSSKETDSKCVSDLSAKNTSAFSAKSSSEGDVRAILQRVREGMEKDREEAAAKARSDGKVQHAMPAPSVRSKERSAARPKTSDSKERQAPGKLYKEKAELSGVDRRHQSPQAGNKFQSKDRATKSPDQTKPKTSSFQRIQLSMEKNKKELEAELKYCINRKDVLMATEAVGKIHKYESMKIDRGLVLNLLHLLIREGAVPQLMKIFTFVCNQGIFNEEVCNAYIRLGCSESSKYDRQLKNIFQYLRRYNVQPAGDCMTALLSVYSEHKGDPKMFWLMLSYFETLPGYAVPLPLLHQAIAKLLLHRDRDALTKFNHWVLTSKTGVLKKMELPVIGKMAVILQSASMSQLQKVLEFDEGDQVVTDMEPLPQERETVLVQPIIKFSDQDFHFYCQRIQENGACGNWLQMAQLFVELCRKPGGNRPLLDKYAEQLMQQDLVSSVDVFLRSLFQLYQQDEAKKSLPEVDRLALAHLGALVLDRVSFSHHAELILTLLDVIVQCPLVGRKLLVNCNKIGFKMIAACLECGRLLQAIKILKDVRLSKNDQQGRSLVMDFLRRLVSTRDIPSAFSVLNTVACCGSIDLSSLSSQLTWHALNAGNVAVALDLLDLQQKQLAPSPSSPPPPLLRALLVACCQAGYVEKTDALFDTLKDGKVYNAEALNHHPYVFQLSTMLTPVEMRLCVLDRLEELYHKLCKMVAAGQALEAMDRGFAIQIVAEHDPQLLALPFLALAPRSLEQARQVLTQVLRDISPPLQSTVNEQIQLVVIEPSSLVVYLRQYDSTGLKQGLIWKDEASLLPGTPMFPASPLTQTQSSSAALPGRQTTAQLLQQQPSLPLGRQMSLPAATKPQSPRQSPHPASRQQSVPASAKPCLLPELAREMKRRASAPPARQTAMIGQEKSPALANLNRGPHLPSSRFDPLSKPAQKLTPSRASVPEGLFPRPKRPPVPLFRDSPPKEQEISPPKKLKMSPPKNHKMSPPKNHKMSPPKEFPPRQFLDGSRAPLLGTGHLDGNRAPLLGTGHLDGNRAPLLGTGHLDGNRAQLLGTGHLDGSRAPLLGTGHLDGSRVPLQETGHLDGPYQSQQQPRTQTRGQSQSIFQQQPGSTQTAVERHKSPFARGAGLLPLPQKSGNTWRTSSPRWQQTWNKDQPCPGPSQEPQQQDRKELQLRYRQSDQQPENFREPEQWGHSLNPPEQLREPLGQPNPFRQPSKQAEHFRTTKSFSQLDQFEQPSQQSEFGVSDHLRESQGQPDHFEQPFKQPEHVGEQDRFRELQRPADQLEQPLKQQQYSRATEPFRETLRNPGHFEQNLGYSQYVNKSLKQWQFREQPDQVMQQLKQPEQFSEPLSFREPPKQPEQFSEPLSFREAPRQPDQFGQPLRQSQQLNKSLEQWQFEEQSDHYREQSDHYRKQAELHPAHDLAADPETQNLCPPQSNMEYHQPGPLRQQGPSRPSNMEFHQTGPPRPSNMEYNQTGPSRQQGPPRPSNMEFHQTGPSRQQGPPRPSNMEFHQTGPSRQQGPPRPSNMEYNQTGPSRQQGPPRPSNMEFHQTGPSRQQGPPRPSNMEYNQTGPSRQQGPPRPSNMEYNQTGPSRQQGPPRPSDMEFHQTGPSRQQGPPRPSNMEYNQTGPSRQQGPPRPSNMEYNQTGPSRQQGPPRPSNMEYNQTGPSRQQGPPRPSNMEYNQTGPSRQQGPPRPSNMEYNQTGPSRQQGPPRPSSMEYNQTGPSQQQEPSRPSRMEYNQTGPSRQQGPPRPSNMEYNQTGPSRQQGPSRPSSMEYNQTGPSRQQGVSRPSSMEYNQTGPSRQQGPSQQQPVWMAEGERQWPRQLRSRSQVQQGQQRGSKWSQRWTT